MVINMLIRMRSVLLGFALFATPARNGISALDAALVQFGGDTIWVGLRSRWGWPGSLAFPSIISVGTLVRPLVHLPRSLGAAMSLLDFFLRAFRIAISAAVLGRSRVRCRRPWSGGRRDWPGSLA